MKSDLHDVEVVYQHETPQAVCVRAHETAKDVWIPKSMCEVAGGQRRGGVVTLTASTHILIEKGLL